MNGDEVGLLLGLMALADNRKPPEDEEGQNAMIAFWLSMVGDLSYADAAQAVQQHYRETRDWIMPADIRKRVKAIRADRVARSIPPAPAAELADEPGRYQRILQANIQRIADGRSLQRAIAGPLEGEPPAEWQEAKAALRDSEGAPVDPRLKALEQVEESRRARQEREERGEAS